MSTARRLVTTYRTERQEALALVLYSVQQDGDISWYCARALWFTSSILAHSESAKMLSLLESIRNNLINVNSAIHLRLILGYVSQSGIKLRIFTKQLIIENIAISYGNREKRGKILRPTLYWYFFIPYQHYRRAPVCIKCDMIVPNWCYSF